jgi:hypothetical protein
VGRHDSAGQPTTDPGTVHGRPAKLPSRAVSHNDPRLIAPPDAGPRLPGRGLDTIRGHRLSAYGLGPVSFVRWLLSKLVSTGPNAQGFTTCDKPLTSGYVGRADRI